MPPRIAAWPKLTLILLLLAELVILAFLVIVVWTGRNQPDLGRLVVYFTLANAAGLVLSLAEAAIIQIIRAMRGHAHLRRPASTPPAQKAGSNSRP